MSTSIMYFAFALLVMAITLHDVLSVEYTENWITASSSLPQMNGGMAVGEWNGSIFMIGGYPQPRAFVEYNTFTQQMIDHNTSYISRDTESLAQFWTQISHNVFMIDPQGDTFSVMDLSTKQFISHWNGVTITTNVGPRSCLASTDDYLYVIGGYNANDGILNKLQIINTNTLQWIANTPSMNHSLEMGACLVHHEFLYAIGGLTIEKINVNHLQQWQLTAYQLLQHVGGGHRALGFGNDILVIGGEGYTFYKRIEVIDTITEEVTSAVDMNYGVSMPGVIITNNILYAFGGMYSFFGDEYESRWQFYNLPVTKTPTNAPSFHPTNAPSIQPLIMISNQPSIAPSIHPSTITSRQPSVAPSLQPSITSSIPSSVAPSIAPFVSVTSIDVSDVSEESNGDNVWLILSVCVVLILCGGVTIWIKSKYKKKESLKDEDNGNNKSIDMMVRIEDVATPGLPEWNMKPVNSKMNVEVLNPSENAEDAMTIEGSGEAHMRARGDSESVNRKGEGVVNKPTIDINQTTTHNALQTQQQQETKGAYDA